MKRIEKKPVEKITPQYENVVFSFKYLQPVSYTECRDLSFFISWVNRLNKYSQLTWTDLYTSQRHSFGTENIPIHSLKRQPNLPKDFEADSLIALRATGSNHPMLGFRENNIYHVVFLESQFGDIYNH
ncbi:MAG: hypothetical protein LIP03_09075 [Bacteroidales bacterium]|nr:hypothetical protein [Bacteroidales bacterium]